MFTLVNTSLIGRTYTVEASPPRMPRFRDRDGHEAGRTTGSAPAADGKHRYRA